MKNIFRATLLLLAVLGQGCYFVSAAQLEHKGNPQTRSILQTPRILTPIPTRVAFWRSVKNQPALLRVMSCVVPAQLPRENQLEKWFYTVAQQNNFRVLKEMLDTLKSSSGAHRKSVITDCLWFFKKALDNKNLKIITYMFGSQCFLDEINESIAEDSLCTATQNGNECILDFLLFAENFVAKIRSKKTLEVLLHSIKNQNENGVVSLLSNQIFFENCFVEAAGCNQKKLISKILIAAMRQKMDDLIRFLIEQVNIASQISPEYTYKVLSIADHLNNNQMVGYLLDNPSFVNSIPNENLMDLFYIAQKHNHETIMADLLEKPAFLEQAALSRDLLETIS